MSDNKVINFQAKREENIEKKRRSFERICFNNFMGAYSVVESDGYSYPINMVDISRDGLSFNVPWNEKTDSKLKLGDDLKLKVYFTKGSYIPVIVKIRHSALTEGADGVTYMQYGCEFDKSMHSFKAMEQFINFIYTFSEYSVVDNGEMKSLFI